MSKPEQMPLGGVDTREREVQDPKETVVCYHEMPVGRGVGQGQVTQRCAQCKRAGVFKETAKFWYMVHVVAITPATAKSKAKSKMVQGCVLTGEQALPYRKQRNEGL